MILHAKVGKGGISELTRPSKKIIIKCEFKLFETLIWAETEGAGGPDLPMKIISCHLFPRRKTGIP